LNSVNSVLSKGATVSVKLFSMRTPNLKGILCLTALLTLYQISQAQVTNVSFGTEAINDKAILWLKSNGNQGVILPVIPNRSNFTGLNNSDDKGMMIYDASDNKVYFWNGSQWVEAGGGVGGGGAQTLTLSGNTFTLSGSPASNVNISTSAPASGQALVWNGSQWVATSLAGDVTGAVGSTVVSGLKGKTIPNLPSTTNALVYDGTAWTFQALSSTGEANTASNVGTGGQGVFKQKSALNLEFYKINAGSNKVTVALDGANNEVDIDVNNLNLVVAATQVTGLGTLATLSVIGSTQITDGSITSADLQDGAVTGNKISIPGASTGQVLKFNGSTWTAQADDVGAGATPTLANGQLLTGNGTSNSATAVTGDITLSGGAMTIKTNVVTTGMIQALAVDGTRIADNSVNSAKISDGTITSVDILDATVSSLDIANGGVATVDILDGAVTGAKIATTGASSGQVLKYNGTTWLPQNDDTGSGITLADGQLLTGNGTSNSATTVTGDIALSGGAMTIKTNVVTTGMIQALAVDGTKIADNSINSAKISDGTIASVDILDATISSLDIANGAVATVDILNGAVTGAKISTTGASLGQVLKYDGTTWLPQNDDTGSGGFSTANEVPRGDGTTLVSSNIYSDGTNVGIGTNAPRSILELMNGNLILSGSAGAPDDPVDIDFKTHVSTNLFKAKIWTDPAANTLWFSTSTTPASRKDITIDPNGNVGIGTTSPTQKLDVREGGISVTHSTSSATLNIHSPNVGGASNQITFQKGGVTNWALGGANIGSAGPTDFSLYNYTTASNALTVSSANGNVGIATTTPAYALTIGAGHFAMENSAQLIAKNSGGAYESYLWPRYSDDIMYLNYGAGGFAVRNNASANTMFMTSGGNVGIGTTTPQAPLHIASNAGTAGSILAYTLWNHFSGGFQFGASGNFTNNAIRADGNVWCNGFAFVATSDKRIKTVLGKTNNQKDLNKLMDIEITDYQFIDTISQGDRVHKKVIAQQLKAVYPNAINKTSGVIPNVFETAKQVKVEGKKTTIETSKPHQFVTGDEVKLVLEQGGEKQFKVTVLNEKEFEVGAVISGKIFVYGKNVNDLLTVDYDALTTLNISATQQLSKEVDSLKSKLNDKQQIQIEALKKELDEVKNEREVLKSENELLESKVNTIQQDVEEVKRVLGLQATKN
jgi:hypothetical protein